jgi:hypothetical protein
MAWPTPQDYNEAVQNPAHSFADPELRSGNVETTALGLPRPITGNFASVYRIRCSGKDWAVRCFWREYADMQERYEAIARRLQVVHLPYTVGFEYLSQGIRVKGKWFPILKMEWVDGVLLNDYLAAHLGDPTALRQLAGRWMEMVEHLQGASIAHGDLQHGNVLVLNGGLKLVDYDGVYVPALAGKRSHELGHQNYQHPLRSESTFGVNTDSFSAWVIYVSLLATARQPDLWTQLLAGDECLLFRKSDFCSPDSSRVFQTLLGHTDSEIRELTSRLRASLSERPERVQHLRRELPEVRGIGRGFLVARPARAAWRVLAPAAPRLAFQAASASPTVTLPSWLETHVVARVPLADFGPPKRLARLAPWLLGVAILAAAGPAIANIAVLAPALLVSVPFAAFLILGLLLLCYHRDPAVSAMKSVMHREAQQARALASIHRGKERLDRQLARLHARSRQAMARADKRRERLRRKEQVDRSWSARIDGARIEAIQDRLTRLGDREAAEIAAALQSLQARHVRKFLRRRTIRAAQIPRVTFMVKCRLWIHGIRNAADLDSDRIRSIQDFGERTLLALATWRVGTEREARRTVPSSLPEARRARIARPYARKTARAEAARDSAARANARLVEVLGEWHGRRHRAIDTHTFRHREMLEEHVTDINRELQELTQQAAPLVREIEELRREYTPFVKIRFARYLMHVWSRQS